MSRSRARSMSRLDLLVLVVALLMLDTVLILDGKKQEVRKGSAGRERINFKKSSSPSKEVARAVVSFFWTEAAVWSHNC